MGACKQKQNLRYQKADARWHKKYYKGLSEDEKKMVKLTEKHDKLEKDLGYFWSNAPRKNTGQVDWDNCTDEQLNYFEYINKKKESTLKAIIKLENKGIMQDNVMKLFMQINTKSVCF